MSETKGPTQKKPTSMAPAPQAIRPVPAPSRGKAINNSLDKIPRKR